MGKRTTTTTMGLRGLIGTIKDKVSLSRAALLSKPNSTLISLRLAVLRVTTHDASAPPRDKHLAALLSAGDGSRATASALIEALMDRLQSTHSAAVALKCLVAAHHIAKRGGFILQDQISVFPASGGRNYLKLSAFRDGASPDAWRLSAWVRWYAAYVEHLLSTSRALGFFLGAADIDRSERRVISLMNGELLGEIESLVSLVGEIHRAPDESAPVRVNSALLDEIMGLVGEDYMSAIDELSLRVGEFRNRLSWMSFGESVELACALRRLEDCKERLSALFAGKSGLREEFWGLISEVKGDAGKVSASGEEEGRRVAVTCAGGRPRRVSESARYGERVPLSSGNSARFSSGR